MVEGNYTGLADHFQILDWLLLELEKTKQKFLKLSAYKQKQAEAQNYKYLAGCLEAVQVKYKKYYIKADNIAAYYAVIILNPTLKIQQFKD